MRNIDHYRVYFRAYQSRSPSPPAGEAAQRTYLPLTASSNYYIAPESQKELSRNLLRCGLCSLVGRLSNRLLHKTYPHAVLRSRIHLQEVTGVILAQNPL